MYAGEPVMESAEAVVEAADPASPTSPGADESLETVPEGAGGYDAAKDMADASTSLPPAALAQLQAQVEAQQQQLEVESKTNAELEDMLLRIEKHFKAEQVARRKAEEQAASAEAQIAEERELREKAQLELKNRMHEGERNAALKAASGRGRAARSRRRRRR